MRWDRINILVDKIKDDLDKDGYVLSHVLNFLCPTVRDCFTGTSKSTQVIQTLKRIKLVLFVQIAWTIWIEPTSYKPLLLNGPSTGNYEN